MATPIKTQVLQQLMIALQATPSLVTVERFPPTAISLDNVQAPIAYLHEPSPEVREKNNRSYQGILELDIAVFIELKSEDKDNGNVTFLDHADLIQAEMHNVLFGGTATNLKGFGLKILEQSSEKLVPNDQWGVLLYSIEVTYSHATGNAFSTTT